jgi:hypothetical protein
MSGKTSIPFAGQRIVCVALVFGMLMYAIVAGVMLQMNEGNGIAEAPIEELNLIAMILGAALGAGAIAARLTLNKRAEAVAKEDRGNLRLLSRLVPIAIIEAGCLFAITAWMLNGQAVPALAVACILLSIAIAMIPLHDPDIDSI